MSCPQPRSCAATAGQEGRENEAAAEGTAAGTPSSHSQARTCTRPWPASPSALLEATLMLPSSPMSFSWMPGMSRSMTKRFRATLTHEAGGGWWVGPGGCGRAGGRAGGREGGWGGGSADPTDTLSHHIRFPSPLPAAVTRPRDCRCTLLAAREGRRECRRERAIIALLLLLFP